jgi:hypothetical protein
LRRTDFHLPEALHDSRSQWQKYFSILPADASQRPVIEGVLLPAFSAADHLAVYYSLIYRSAYVFNFLFAAIAVALALCGIFAQDRLGLKSLLVGTELSVIVAILLTWWKGHHAQWHRRWLEYRRLAECLRHMRVLAPAASGGPINRPGRSLDVDEQDWVNWYAWSLRRLIPLPDRVVDAPYVAALRDAVLSTEVADQLGYHSANAERIDRLDRRMHAAGQRLFQLTLVLCCLFLVGAAVVSLLGFEHPRLPLALEIFTFFTALLPTLGASIGAIHVQGDFRTVAEQSRRTATRLAALRKVLSSEPPAFARLADRIGKTSDVMMADLLEWETVFRTRPLSLPA